MREQWSVYDSLPSDTPSFDPPFDSFKFLAFSGWTLLSLGLWAGIIETVRLLFF